MNYKIKDSGKRQEYPTGAVRDTSENKIRWDLLPVEALKRVAIHYTNGAKKYAPNNWKKGIPTDRFIESAMRHFMQWRLGERDEDHLSAVVFNIFGIIYNEEKENMPEWFKKELEEKLKQEVEPKQEPAYVRLRKGVK